VGELGLHVCGGRGRHSRRTPDELLAVANRTGLDGDALGHSSRLVAKVDSAAVQDGYELYLHGFIVADDGKWVVVQQGMNGDTRYARRYHWLSEGVTSFVEAPHAAIDGRNAGEIVNLTDRRAAASRAGQIELLHELGPDGIVREAARLASDRLLPSAPTLPHLVMPAHHEVRPKDVMLRRLQGALAAAAERGPSDFTDLLLVPGIGARTVRSLALVAEVIHGAPCRFADPARHSFAHGGKDRQPFPVPTKVYDQTIAVLKDAVKRAKLGRDDRLHAIRRLDDAARRLERTAPGPTFYGYLGEERRQSPEYGGRSVFGWEGADCEGAADGPDEPAASRRGRSPAS
jgi:uncharacterized protein